MGALPLPFQAFKHRGPLVDPGAAHLRPRHPRLLPVGALVCGGLQARRGAGGSRAGEPAFMCGTLAGSAADCMQICRCARRRACCLHHLPLTLTLQFEALAPRRRGVPDRNLRCEQSAEQLNKGGPLAASMPAPRHRRRCSCHTEAGSLAGAVRSCAAAAQPLPDPTCRWRWLLPLPRPSVHGASAGRCRRRSAPSGRRRRQAQEPSCCGARRSCRLPEPSRERG